MSEQSHESSETCYHLLFEHAADAIVTVDQDGTIHDANLRFRQLLGYSREELLGEPCSLLFHPEDLAQRPLRWDELRKCGDLRSERRIRSRLASDNWYEVHTTLLPNGLAQSIIRDVTRQKEAKEELRYRLAIERMVTTISTELIKTPAEKIDAVINQQLGLVGSFAGADRASIFLFSGDGLRASNTHEWCDNGIESVLGGLQDLDLAVFGWWVEKLQAFETIHIDIDALPEHAVAERASLEAQGIRSVLALPLRTGEKLIGFIGFDSVRRNMRWSDADVSLLGLVGEIFVHAIEKQRTEQLFLEQNERFLLLTQATQDVVYDWSVLDQTMAWNQVLTDVYGYQHGDSVHLNDWWKATIHPDDLDRVLQTYDEAFGSTTKFWSGEYRFRRADGTYAWVLDRCGIIRDAGGRAVRVVGVMVDLTERRRAEEKLAMSEEYFRSVIENIADVIAILDEQGTILYESPALFAMLGYQPEEQVGRTAFDFIHPDDLPHVAREFEQGVAVKGRTEVVQYRYLHKDGSWRILESSGINMLDNPAVRGIVVTTRDVTQRIVLEQQLEQANRLTGLGRLAASIAHEMNNVLMGIQPFAERIRRLVVNDERIVAATEHILRAVDRGRRVTGEVLQFTRVSEPVVGPVEVGPWLRQFAPELRALITPSIALQIDIEPDLWMLCDSTQLQQVLVNLTTNAGDAMPEGGRLGITVRRGTAADSMSAFGGVSNPEDFVHFVVTDSGHGIQPELLPHLFDPLFTTKPAGKGTGLGLAVAHQIVSKHHGSIFVAPRTDSPGSAFHVYIPVTAERPRQREKAAEQDEIGALRVLLVDDDELVAIGIRDLLEADGHEVIVARTGEEALEIAAECNPDVLILDIGLPGISGLTVYEELSRIRPGIPAVFSSGHGDRRITERYVGDPHVVALFKPYELEELSNALAKATSS